MENAIVKTILAASLASLATLAIVYALSTQDAAKNCKLADKAPDRVAVLSYTIDTKPGKDQAGAILLIIPGKRTYQCFQGDK